jgi:hypothetical protein
VGLSTNKELRRGNATIDRWSVRVDGIGSHWGVPESFSCPKWEIRPCDVTRIKFCCDVTKNFPFWMAGCLLNKIDKSYLMFILQGKTPSVFVEKSQSIIFCFAQPLRLLITKSKT